MQPVIAKHNLGPCEGCGVNVDVGEWAIHHTAGVTHAGCIPRQKLDEVGREKRESSEDFGLKKENSDQVREGSRHKEEPHSGYLFSETETAIIDRAKDALGVKRIEFDGATVLGIDRPRLAGQLARVFEVLRDGRFRTLAEIAGVTGDLESSVSSRIRDFRKARLGGHTVNSRPRTTSPLTYEYQLILREGIERNEQRNAA